MCAKSQSNGYHIEHVHNLVFPGELGGKGELCVIYDCYLDDSKDERQEHVYVCAGFSAPQHVWKKFRIEWDHALAIEGLDYWKTSESKALVGKFAKYKGMDRDAVNAAILAIKTRLMRVALKHTRIRGIAVSIPVDVYSEVMSSSERKTGLSGARPL